MIKASEQNIGENFKLADGSSIQCKKLIIGNDVTIGYNTQIFCPEGTVVIGDQSYIGNDSTIRLANFEIGEYCKLHNHALLNGVGNVKIGHNCWIGQNSILNGEASLTIGNNVGIGTYSSVWTHGYFGQLIDGCVINSIKDTIIEDDAWLIGSYNTIFPGVIIGKQAVLMGTSVVTKSLESNRIYSGNPAKDITDKIGAPYKPLLWDDKKNLLKKTFLEYFEKNNVSYSHEEDSIQLDKKGRILFSLETEISEGDVAFVENANGFIKQMNGTIFCLTEKKYSKRYSELEIFVKKILSPTVARFIPTKE